jgi:hypothetical protein
VIGYVIGSLLYYPMVWVIIFTLPVAALLLAGTVYGLRRRTLAEIILLSFFAALVLPFSFLPGKMAHWTLPAIVVMSILSARMILVLRRRIKTSHLRKAVYAYDTLLLLLILLSTVTALNTARAMGDASLSVPDPKSPLTYSLVPVFNSSRLFVSDLKPIVAQLKPRVILAPNWVTASEVMFYLPEFRASTYVFQFDYQLGTVWKMDVGYAPRSQLNGSVVAIYSSQGNVTSSLLYSVLVHNDRGNSLYQRTGLDTFTILRMPTVRLSYVENRKPVQVSTHPYAIVLASYSGTSHVSITSATASFNQETSHRQTKRADSLKWNWNWLTRTSGMLPSADQKPNNSNPLT